MEWLNDPPAWQAQGESLIVRAGPQTDFWRTTHHGFVRDTGHFWFQSWHGDFVAAVKVTGDYRDRYDQAGLMVRVDEQVWLKCGGSSSSIAFSTRAPSSPATTPTGPLPRCQTARRPCGSGSAAPGRMLRCATPPMASATNCCA